MCYNRALDVLRIQYIFFSECQMYPHLVGSTFFFLVFVVTIYLFFTLHKFFRVSGLGISARARGNFVHNNILRHTSKQFAIRWAGTWILSRRGTCNRRAAWQKTLYIRWLMLCIIFLFSSFSLSWGCLGGSLCAVGRTPRGLLRYVLINDIFLVEFDF